MLCMEAFEPRLFKRLSIRELLMIAHTAHGLGNAALTRAVPRESVEHVTLLGGDFAMMPTSSNYYDLMPKDG